ncbi:MAG: hypothetical protein HYV09_40325 [Deltaproteobacteria bacterium]|nr:hypothetical protein [Deltaproteobacteria bacterium]
MTREGPTSDREAPERDAGAAVAGATERRRLGEALAGASERRRLEEAFAPWRASVNRHLVFRSGLDGLTVGAVAGTAWALGAYGTHHPALRVGGLALAAVGAIAGAVRGAQRAWTDDRVALYVDGVLGTPESVTSAIALGREAPPEVVEAAVRALEDGPRRAPGRLRRMHGLALAGTIACVAILALKAPRPAQASPPPGTDVVKLTEVPGLDKVAAVEKLPAKDAAQKERFDKIAEEARELKKKLLEGMPRRDALDALNKLRQKLDAEKLGANQNKAGLDAAVQALKSSGFPGLADALEDRDLQSFDEMMERIANEREESDRQKAREALEKGIDEAKKKGADDVAKALEKQKQKLDARKDKGDVLRELADALKGTPGDPGHHGKSYDDKATDDAARELGDALRKGLEKLTPEERKKLADRLKEQAEKGGSSGKMSPKAKQKLKDLADKLKSKEGQKELEKELKDLANGGGEGGQDDDDHREKGLDDADEGTDDAGKELGDKDGKGKDGKGKDGKGKDGKGKDGKDGDGKDGKGKDGKGKDGDGKDGSGDGKDGDGKGDGKDGNGGLNLDTPGGDPGGSPGGSGDGDHKGKSKKLDAESLKAKAKGMGMGTPKPTGGKVTTPGTDGATATVKGTGDLAGTAADEVNGVDKADVPEAVRRQVKAYFE